MEPNEYFKHLNILEDLESRPLLEMAMERSELINKIRSKRDLMEEHLLKCMIYENTTNDLKHWVSEVSSYIGKIANDTVKPNNKKLTKNQYCAHLFGYDYDSLSNMDTILDDFQYKMGKRGYPDFKITKELKEKCFSIGNPFMLEVSKILSENKKCSNRDFGDLLLSLLIKNGAKL